MDNRAPRRLARWIRPLRIFNPHQSADRHAGYARDIELSMTPQPTHGMFQGAQNTRVQNATFNIYTPGTTDGGRTTSTDDRHELSATYCSPLPASILQSSNPISPPVGSNIVANTLSISSDLHAAPSELYRDRLQRKNLGHPLWIPGPDERLSAAYREFGVMVGDVGVITPRGSFCHLFSVVYEATHPRNAGLQLPPNFIPFTTSPEMCDIEQFLEYDSTTGSYLADDSVMRVSDVNNNSTILQTSARQAAVLMLPETVHTKALLSIVPLRDYIRKNLHSWYKFVRDVKGWDVKNGDIRVVHSCRKSTGYGIATVSNGTPDPITELTFSVQEPRTNVPGCKYSWSHKGCATVKAGPSHNLGRNQAANQCLFVGTIDFKLAHEQWRNIEHSEVATILSLQDHHNESQAQSPHQSVGKDDLLRGSGPSGYSNSNPYSQWSSYGLTQVDVGEKRSTPRLLPSDILANVLMGAVPSATSVSVCTQNWGPYFTDLLEDESQFIYNVLSDNDICEKDGMAYLNPKGSGSVASEPILHTGNSLYSITDFERPYSPSENVSHSHVLSINSDEVDYIYPPTMNYNRPLPEETLETLPIRIYTTAENTSIFCPPSPIHGGRTGSVSGGNLHHSGGSHLMMSNSRQSSRWQSHSTLPSLSYADHRPSSPTPSSANQSFIQPSLNQPIILPLGQYGEYGYVVVPAAGQDITVIPTHSTVNRWARAAGHVHGSRDSYTYSLASYSRQSSGSQFSLPSLSYSTSQSSLSSLLSNNLSLILPVHNPPITLPIGQDDEDDHVVLPTAGEDSHLHSSRESCGSVYNSAQPSRSRSHSSLPLLSHPTHQSPSLTLSSANQNINQLPPNQPIILPIGQYGEGRYVIVPAAGQNISVVPAPSIVCYQGADTHSRVEEVIPMSTDPGPQTTKSRVMAFLGMKRR